MNLAAQQFEITPCEAAGAVRFGMLAAQVREQLGSTTTSPNRELPYDLFRNLGIRVHYGPSAGVEAIEFLGPAFPTLHGRRLLRQRYGELEHWIRTLDPNVKLEHSGLTSNLLGVRLYATSARNNPDAPVEVVTVFDKDYYRRYMESIVPPPPR